jgi:hypothetical protein
MAYNSVRKDLIEAKRRKIEILQKRHFNVRSTIIKPSWFDMQFVWVEQLV